MDSRARRLNLAGCEIFFVAEVVKNAAGTSWGVKNGSRRMCMLCPSVFFFFYVSLDPGFSRRR